MYRLPDNVIPTRYELTIKPYFAYYISVVLFGLLILMELKG